MSDRDKDAEILALRHQLAVMQRRLGPRRVSLHASDRAVLAALLHRLPRNVLHRVHLVVKPDTSLPDLGLLLGARILGEIGDDSTRITDARRQSPVPTLSDLSGPSWYVSRAGEMHGNYLMGQQCGENRADSTRVYRRSVLIATQIFNVRIHRVPPDHTSPSRCAGGGRAP
jgi:hypothetical protein